MTNKLRVFVARTASLPLLLLAVSIAALAQGQTLKINYHLAMSHPISHLFEVSIEVEAPPEAKLDSLDFQMPKWSPGRYAMFDFAKNVQEVSASSVCPRNIKCEQI